jgi:hypothetical protein
MRHVERMCGLEENALKTKRWQTLFTDFMHNEGRRIMEEVRGRSLTPDPVAPGAKHQQAGSKNATPTHGETPIQPKKRGRPRKDQSLVLPLEDNTPKREGRLAKGATRLSIEAVQDDEPKRRRQSQKEVIPQSIPQTTVEPVQNATPRKRGRPRKIRPEEEAEKLEAKQVEEVEQVKEAGESNEVKEIEVVKVPKKRGRPPKDRSAEEGPSAKKPKPSTEEVNDNVEARQTDELASPFDESSQPPKIEKQPTASPEKQDPNDAEVKELISWLAKCGMRKVWYAEFKRSGVDTQEEKINYLKKALTELGMKEEYTEEQAEQIKTRRELDQEAKDALDYEAEHGIKLPSRKARVNHLADIGWNHDDEESDRNGFVGL